MKFEWIIKNNWNQGLVQISSFETEVNDRTLVKASKIDNKKEISQRQQDSDSQS